MSRRFQPAITSAAGEMAKQNWPHTLERIRRRRKARKLAAYLQRTNQKPEVHEAKLVERRKAKGRA